MKEIIDVLTGEVKRGDSETILVSYGIGSCIVVAALHAAKQIGGMAHIMLPGKAPLKEHLAKTKYAEDAIEELLRLMETDASTSSQVKVCLIGAGNVLNKADDSICKCNIDSVVSLLTMLNIEISALSLGGNMRRTVRFDVGTGEVHFTEGDSGLMLLNQWK